MNADADVGLATLRRRSAALVREIVRYSALYEAPAITRQLEPWREELATVTAEITRRVGAKPHGAE